MANFIKINALPRRDASTGVDMLINLDVVSSIQDMKGDKTMIVMGGGTETYVVNMSLAQFITQTGVPFKQTEA
jgi:hypothetical protein